MDSSSSVHKKLDFLGLLYTRGENVFLLLLYMSHCAESDRQLTEIIEYISYKYKLIMHIHF